MIDRYYLAPPFPFDEPEPPSTCYSFASALPPSSPGLFDWAPVLSPPDGYEVWESDPGWWRWTKWLGGEIIATSHQRFITEERAWVEAERDRAAGYLPIRTSFRTLPF